MLTNECGIIIRSAPHELHGSGWTSFPRTGPRRSNVDVARRCVTIDFIDYVPNLGKPLPLSLTSHNFRLRCTYPVNICHSEIYKELLYYIIEEPFDLQSEIMAAFNGLGGHQVFVNLSRSLWRMGADLRFGWD